MSEERQHHEFGCSKWPDLMRCADYQATGGSSPAAERGTRIHKYWELLGTDEAIDGDADPEEVAHAAWAVGQIDELSQGAKVEWERRIDCKEPEYFGYLDACWYENPETIVICDGKSGQGNDEQWIQLVGYAHALMLENESIKQAKLHFIYWDRREIKSYEFSRDAVLNEVKKLLEHVSTGDRATGVQCNRCKLYETCGKVQGVLLRTWQTDYQSVWNSPAALSELRDDLDFLDKMRDKVTDRIKELVESGTEVPGFRVYTRKGQSSVDVRRAWESLQNEISADDFLKCCSVKLKALQSMYQLRTGEELSGDFITPGIPKPILTKRK